MILFAVIYEVEEITFRHETNWISHELLCFDKQNVQCSQIILD